MKCYAYILSGGEAGQLKSGRLEGGCENLALFLAQNMDKGKRGP